MKDPAIVADYYGNNYAVICYKCARPFVVSRFMDKKKGERACPHCNQYTVQLTDLPK